MPNLFERNCGNATVTSVIVPETNSETTATSIVPTRFNSTSQLSERSIVRPELNSVSDRRTRSDEPTRA